MGQLLTPAQLRDLMADLLEGAAGGDASDWRAAIGPVEKHPLWSHTRCNWTVEPKGRRSQREAIERAADIVRDAHPYVG
jgi:hypothetical protein